MRNSSQFGRIWKAPGAVPLALFIILIAILNSRESFILFEMPIPLAFLNSIFLCIIPLIVAFLAAKSHHATGSLSFKFMGCGLIVFGYSSLLAGWVMPLSGGPNPTVTLHNVGSLLAGLCQVAGAHYAFHEIMVVQKTKDRMKNCFIVYAVIVLAISIVGFLAFKSYLPLFFNQITGPTLLRQTVLGGAICLFVLAGYLFMVIYSTTKTDFAYWYGLALWFIAVGLAGVFLQHKVGDALGWAGRASQYVGCSYLILTFLMGRRDLALTDDQHDRNADWNLWPFLEQKVIERTSELSRMNEALLQEILERKEAQDALTRVMNELNIILENAPLGISKIIDRKQVLVNRKTVDLFQYSKEEMEFQTTRKLYPSDEKYEKMGQEAYPVLAQGLVFETEQELIRKDGTHVLVRYIGKAIEPPDMSKGTIWLLEDITERKHVEMQLITAKEAAESANRAKSEFLANMSHEIRTPMNGLLCMTQLLEMTDLTKEQQEYVAALQLSGKNLLSLMSDILDLSKIEAGRITIELADFSLHQSIKDIAMMQKQLAHQKGLLLNVNLADDIPHVMRGDQLRIKQILLNLLGNAIKFTVDGGVTVSTQLLEQHDDTVLIQIAVRDTGIGVSPGALEQIFKPFVQEDGSTTRKYGGTGLGLTISRRLVELMGGSVSVESTPGAGSYFKVNIPFAVVKGNRVSQAPLIKTTVSWDGPPLRILLAEDDQTNITFATSLFRKLGLDAIVVKNGRECLAALEQSRFDLVLMDIQMPVMNGEEALKEIRGKEQTTSLHQAVIALTAYSMRGDKERFLEEGFDGYLSKPLVSRELVREMKRVMSAAVIAFQSTP